VDKNGTSFHYRDIRRFGKLELGGRKNFSTDVPDAWTASDETVLSALKSITGYLKTRASQPKVSRGLGNIYVDEALHLARLHPLAKAALCVRPIG